VAPELCARERLPLRLAVHRLLADGGEAPDAAFVETITQPPCARALEGLAAGGYQVQVERAGDGEPLSASQVEVVAGRRVDVALTRAVQVAGRVAFADDHPASDLLLRFEAGGRAWTARTDLDGRYRVALGGPGEYAVTVGAAAGAAAAAFTRVFTAGEQRQDLRLGDTRLAVRVARADGARLDEAVEILLTSAAGLRLTRTHVPSEEQVAEFKDVPPGVYAVTARTASGLTSRGAAEARLTVQAPQVEVALVLGRHAGRLQVVDEAGRPVPAAGASGGGRELAPTGPGVFPLDGVPLGERVLVRAEGYAPVCRTLQAADLPDLRVALVRPTEELTLHAPPQAAWDSAQVSGLPGSDCPVSIHDLGVSLQLATEGTALALRLPRGRFELLLGAGAVPLVAPGDDVVLTAR
jgi:hypothetical protein